MAQLVIPLAFPLGFGDVTVDTVVVEPTTEVDPNIQDHVALAFVRLCEQFKTKSEA